ncbi:MAG: hydrolase, partial [Proteobacteria bacterium]|nr:hydrolase [Pseudomonadota bacterium]
MFWANAACWAYAIILLCLTSAANAAGIQLLNSNPNLGGAIWYPCAAEPKQVPLGHLAVGADFGLTGVKDCPVTGAKLPLIIFSHGRGAWFGAHHDTAEALADAGFVVAAINHPGDNGNDLSRRDDLSSYAS